MKKNKSEFSKALEKLELEAEIIRQKKKITTRRLKKIEAIEVAKEEAKKKEEVEEMIFVKKSSRKTAMLMTLSFSTTGLMFLRYYLKKNPVDFWFCVIAALCFISFYVMKKNAK